MLNQAIDEMKSVWWHIKSVVVAGAGFFTGAWG